MIKKKIVFSIIASALFIFSISNKAVAQKEKGESVFSVSGGGSLTPILFMLERFESEAGINSDSYTSFSEPVISSMYDIGITDFFSMGLAVSYHKFGIDFWEYKWDTSSTGNYVVEDFTETRTLLNIGVRPLLHFGGNENIDFYAGLRLGYSQWTYKETTSNPDYNPENSRNSPMSIQALFGFRAYLSDVFGIHIETAVVTPYLITLGWNLKF